MDYIIFICTLVLTLVFTKFEPVKGWWKSVVSNKRVSYLLLIAFIAPFLGGQQSEADIGIPSGIRLARFIVILLLFAYVSFNLLQKSRVFKLSGASALCMVAYALLAMASFFYSVAPIVSAWKGFEVLVLVLVVISISNELKSLRDILAVLDMVLIVMLFMVISVYVGFVLFPSKAVVHLELSSSLVVTGLFPPINPNTLTQFAATLFTFTFANMLHNPDGKKKIVTMFIIGMAFVAMLLGHSRTSIFSGVIAFGGVLYFGRYRILAILIAIGGAAAFLMTQAISSFIYRGQSEKLFLSMSGRTHFWESVLELFRQSPWIGHGFYAAQRSLLDVSSVDNTYLEVLLGLGIIGAIIFIIPVILSGVNLLILRPVEQDSKLHLVIWLRLMTLFVVLFIRSLTGPSYQVMHPDLIIYMIMIISLASYKRLRKSHDHPLNAAIMHEPVDKETSRILRRRRSG